MKPFSHMSRRLFIIVIFGLLVILLFSMALLFSGDRPTDLERTATAITFQNTTPLSFVNIPPTNNAELTATLLLLENLTANFYIGLTETSAPLTESARLSATASLNGTERLTAISQTATSLRPLFVETETP